MPYRITCIFGNGYTSEHLEVSLMAAPFDPFSEEFKQAHECAYKKGYCENAAVTDWVTTECAAVIERVKAFVMDYIHDDSDGMIDYYDRNIHDRYTVGRWDKTFERTEAKEQQKKTPAKKTPQKKCCANVVQRQKKKTANL